MLALVTGASSGIGLCYSEVLARDYRCDLLMVSNQEEALKAAAGRLSAAYGVSAQWLCMDLSQPEAARRLHDYALGKGMEVDVLVNDAGFFFFDRYKDVPWERIQSMLNLHMVTLAGLTRLFGADMCARGHGYILNMSSICAWMRFPGLQTYDSTKAFVYSFSLSVQPEFRMHGVKLTVVTPGAVDTPLYGLPPEKRRNLLRHGISMKPEKLAAKALKAMFRGRKKCMPGWANHLLRPLVTALPAPLVYAIIKRMWK